MSLYSAQASIGTGRNLVAIVKNCLACENPKKRALDLGEQMIPERRYGLQTEMFLGIFP